MPRRHGLVATLLSLLLVAGCDLSLPGKGVSSPPVPTTDVITGGDIEVTALHEGAAAAPDPTRSAPVAAPQADPTTEEATKKPTEKATEEADMPLPTEEPAPAPPKSAVQLACEKKGGSWVKAVSSGLQTCVRLTRDSGKQCSRSSQCESACLARSGTCAPMKPLLGCNEILQDNGARVTQCID